MPALKVYNFHTLATCFAATPILRDS